MPPNRIEECTRLPGALSRGVRVEPERIAPALPAPPGLVGHWISAGARDPGKLRDAVYSEIDAVIGVDSQPALAGWLSS